MDLQKQINSHNDFTSDSKVIMGDFNAESNERWYTYLERYHLIDVFHGHEGKYSYNSGKLAKWIDFMLLHNLAHDRITKRIIGNEPGVVHNFEDTTLPSEKIPSDHLPLSLRIILK
jgi:endonuclease/exonuclease/phosphatase family metal-dependent hydrolase